MRLIKTKEVLALISVSLSTLNAMVKEGTFPAPKMIGKRQRRWLEDDVHAWVAAQ